jgi:hypothetical protein
MLTSSQGETFINNSVTFFVWEFDFKAGLLSTSKKIIIFENILGNLF